MKQLYLRNIKKGFATNSSSYHTTLVMTEEEYVKWTTGEITVDDNYGDQITYDQWGEDGETDITRYTTPKGEKIVILCESGYDG